ncbi:MAG: hypothetical protein LBS72_03200 [Oscillospiraceae bacterium]|nr:hypothetical protein [Oscillospiraceae bacterium]
MNPTRRANRVGLNPPTGSETINNSIIQDKSAVYAMNMGIKERYGVNINDIKPPLAVQRGNRSFYEYNDCADALGESGPLPIPVVPTPMPEIPTGGRLINVNEAAQISMATVMLSIAGVGRGVESLLDAGASVLQYALDYETSQDGQDDIKESALSILENAANFGDIMNIKLVGVTGYLSNAIDMCGCDGPQGCITLTGVEGDSPEANIHYVIKDAVTGEQVNIIESDENGDLHLSLQPGWYKIIPMDIAYAADEWTLRINRDNTYSLADENGGMAFCDEFGCYISLRPIATQTAATSTSKIDSDYSDYETLPTRVLTPLENAPVTYKSEAESTLPVIENLNKEQATPARAENPVAHVRSTNSDTPRSDRGAQRAKHRAAKPRKRTRTK